mgnify:CR=1 FL=1
MPKFAYRAFAPVYHGLAAGFASMYYGNPSHKLFVIGVTGTAGKSTTVIMAAQILNASGHKAGYITTAGSSDGNSSTVNMHGLSMPGGWMLQQQLSEMVANGCEYAIVECTSEGLAQNRHAGIKFRAALFTNLSPAHLDSHGSFDAYRAAKGKLFSALSDKRSAIIGVNLDDPNKNYFLQFPAGKKFGVSMRTDLDKPEGITCFTAENVEVTDHISFTVKNVKFKLNMFGTFNVTNAALAIACTNLLGVSLEDASQGLGNIGTVPGRMEIIKANSGAQIVIDYAPEPAAMEASLRAVMMMEHEKIIHVFGSTGGHRDVAKRFEFGEISARLADTIIITNDDVYDTDPLEIANNIRQGINDVPSDKKKAQSVEIILDRKSAIAKAIQLAGPKDIVLITGKGSEQFLVLPGNKRVAWDDRKVVRELLKDK